MELHGILGGQHKKRLGQAIRHTVNRHLQVVHCLEQAALGFRGRAIYLVGEDHVGEDGACLELKILGVLIVDRYADDV